MPERLMLYEPVVNQSRPVMGVLSFESDNVFLNFRRYTEWVVEDRVRAIIQSSFAEVPKSAENLVPCFLTDTEVATDISDLSPAIEAGSDKLSSF